MHRIIKADKKIFGRHHNIAGQYAVSVFKSPWIYLINHSSMFFQILTLILHVADVATKTGGFVYNILEHSPSLPIRKSTCLT